MKFSTLNVLDTKRYSTVSPERIGYGVRQCVAGLTRLVYLEVAKLSRLGSKLYASMLRMVGSKKTRLTPVRVCALSVVRRF